MGSILLRPGLSGRASVLSSGTPCPPHVTAQQDLPFALCPLPSALGPSRPAPYPHFSLVRQVLFFPFSPHFAGKIETVSLHVGSEFLRTSPPPPDLTVDPSPVTTKKCAPPPTTTVWAVSRTPGLSSFICHRLQSRLAPPSLFPLLPNGGLQS